MGVRNLSRKTGSPIAFSSDASARCFTCRWTDLDLQDILRSVGSACAYGCHDLDKLGVESVKLLGLGATSDEGASIAGHAPSPYPLDGTRRGDVGQRVTGHEDQVGALPGGDTSSVSEVEDSCRLSRGSGQRDSRRSGSVQAHAAGPRAER